MNAAELPDQSYQPRVIDAVLQKALTTAGAVVIGGARASGKTMTALNTAASFVFLDDPEVQDALAIAPRSLLEGSTPGPAWLFCAIITLCTLQARPQPLFTAA